MHYKLKEKLSRNLIHEYLRQVHAELATDTEQAQQMAVAALADRRVKSELGLMLDRLP